MRRSDKPCIILQGIETFHRVLLFDRWDTLLGFFDGREAYRFAARYLVLIQANYCLIYWCIDKLILVSMCWLLALRQPGGWTFHIKYASSNPSVTQSSRCMARPSVVARWMFNDDVRQTDKEPWHRPATTHAYMHYGASVTVSRAWPSGRSLVYCSVICIYDVVYDWPRLKVHRFDLLWICCTTYFKPIYDQSKLMTT